MAFTNTIGNNNSRPRPLVIFEFVGESKEPPLKVAEVSYDEPVDFRKEYPHSEYVVEQVVLDPVQLYSDYELDLLTRLAHHEAGNQGIDGMRRVVDVVLNRVDDNRFPNDIESVIFAPGQFTTASRLNKQSTKGIDEARTAVRIEVSGDRLDPKSIYFARKPLTTNGLYQFKDHYFSY